MHLRNFPKYYLKDGKRRAVFYTADARDLIAMGWKLEKQSEPQKEAAKKAAEPVLSSPEKIEIEIVDESTSDAEVLPGDFEFMTKTQLLKYAADRGVDLPNNALKSELVEACQKL